MAPLADPARGVNPGCPPGSWWTSAFCRKCDRGLDVLCRGRRAVGQRRDLARMQDLAARPFIVGEDFERLGLVVADRRQRPVGILAGPPGAARAPDHQLEI